MRYIGTILIVAGLIWAVIAFNMSTTIEAKGEKIGSSAFSVEIPHMTINNLGLMEQRRNHLMMASVAIISGIILFGFGSVSSIKLTTPDATLRTCTFCAEQIRFEAKICRFCNRDLLPTTRRSNLSVALPHTRIFEVEHKAMSATEEMEAMAHFGIIFDGVWYHLGKTSYANLSDAVQTAKAREAKKDA